MGGEHKLMVARWYYIVSLLLFILLYRCFPPICLLALSNIAFWKNHIQYIEKAYLVIRVYGINGVIVNLYYVLIRAKCSYLLTFYTKVALV